MRCLRIVVLGVAALAVAGLSVGVTRTVTYTSPAETVVSISTSKDNTLYEDPAGYPAGSFSNGAGQYFFVGRTNIIIDRIRRGVIAFDIASNVPAGATVTSVSLTLHMSRTISGPQSIDLHKTLADWGEGSSDADFEEGMGTAPTTGDATWIHRFFDTATWASPGGDFSATVSASTVVGFTVDDYTWTSAQMVADVQSWLDSPSTNFGWSLIGNEAIDTTAKRFDTKENPTPANHPLLTVHFTCPDSDCDGDGWTDAAEAFIGTDPLNAGTPGGWPPDPAPEPDGNCTVQIDDVTFAATAFGSTTTPRAEIATQNGTVQIDDVAEFAVRFGDSC